MKLSERDRRCAERYEFEGWEFEFYRDGKGWPLNAGGELKRSAGRKFWQMLKRFNGLSEEERARCLVVEQ